MELWDECVEWVTWWCAYLLLGMAGFPWWTQMHVSPAVIIVVLGFGLGGRQIQTLPGRSWGPSLGWSEVSTVSEGCFLHCWCRCVDGDQVRILQRPLHGETEAPAWGFRNSPRLEIRQGACGMRSPHSLSAGREVCTETCWGHQELELAVILTADCTELPPAQPWPLSIFTIFRCFCQNSDGFL